MVEATYDPGTTVAEVAECFEVSAAQLYSWRRQIADGTLDAPRGAMASFARVELAEPQLPALAEASAVPGPASGSSSIAMPDGTSVMIEGAIDPAVIERIVTALRR